MPVSNNNSDKASKGRLKPFRRPFTLNKHQLAGSAETC
jgi:hypothetical protein